jgi:hypothetical protein
MSKESQQVEMWCISWGGDQQQSVLSICFACEKQRVANRLATLHYLTCDFLHGRQKTYCYPKQGRPFFRHRGILNTFDWFFPQNENFKLLSMKPVMAGTPYCTLLWHFSFLVCDYHDTSYAGNETPTEKKLSFPHTKLSHNIKQRFG